MKLGWQIALSTFLLVPTALAHTDASNLLRPIPAAPRNAGVYHVASGTWTRDANVAELGADIIYDNTCPSGYFASIDGGILSDDGRVPSLSSPTDAESRPGCSNAYLVDGFEIAFCTDQPSALWTISFYESVQGCGGTSAAPVASFALQLPGGSAAGSCWVVAIDTTGPPPIVAPFTLQADGDGTFGAMPDTFRVSFSTNLSPTQSANTGPLIAGGPLTCSHWDGTRWDTGPGTAWPLNLAEDGTGMGNTDTIRFEPPTGSYGCAFFGGYPANPFAGLHLELYSNACGICVTACGMDFCFGDGTGTPCPCGNNGPPGRGCLNSTGVGARIQVAGSGSLSADTITLSGDGMPNGSTALYFQGTVQQGGGPGSVFGDGLRCAGGTIVRIGTVSNSTSGTSQYPPTPNHPNVHTAGQITQPGVRTYQIWYRNAVSFCTPAPFNLSQGTSIVWVP
jgi:hypothetical protein